MAGDFAERLAAVDDALVDESGERAEAASGSRTGGRVDDGRESIGGGVVGEQVSGDEVVGDDVARSEAVDADVAALADRVAELEAAVQALRGYAGSVRAVNDRVEERADAAVATAEDCRERVAALERQVGGSPDADGGGRREAAASGPDDRRPVDGRERADAGRAASTAAGGGATGTGERRAADGAAERGRGRATGDGGGGAEGVPWPPSSPRAPYEDPDADDDREQPGLVARLRDAL